MNKRKQIEESRQRKREAILLAAKGLFLKEGFENVSMRGIAAEVGCSPAALYRYFKNKREILSSLRNDGYVEYLHEQRMAYGQDLDPSRRLEMSGRNYIRFAADNPDDFHLMFCTTCEEVDMEKDPVKSAGEAYERFRANIGRVIESGRFGDVDEDTVAFAMWATVHGVSHLNNSGRLKVMSNGKDVDWLIENVLRFVMRATPDYEHIIAEES
ncbi:TetR/AcrR family transcriptional regulator [Salidesulfovibrio brasiliensis]|uniref:TetR/AcrR family transcriptional regulator n=1 Tax=Salidesulfovibrio brasiliensis TaxID=221711 RepID=UPI0006D0CA59|nr:TetR/AcrR family transcriptional regulator [Salidesulfovibrio brasiliensis]